MFQVKTRSPEETFHIGCQLGKTLSGGMVIALNGELGAGKTLLAKGIAKGLGVKDVVSSPTFTLIQEYQGRLPLYHFDFYRLHKLQEIENLGYEEYFYGEGVCLVEWAEKFPSLMPEDLLEIRFLQADQGARERLLKFYFSGSAYTALEEVLKGNAAAGN